VTATTLQRDNDTQEHERIVLVLYCTFYNTFLLNFMQTHSYNMICPNHSSTKNDKESDWKEEKIYEYT
jgi:hypothetical protein